MTTKPSTAGLELVAMITGLDLSDLSHDQFLARLEQLVRETDELVGQHPVDNGVITVTLKTPGFLEAACLEGVLSAERQRLLN